MTIELPKPIAVTPVPNVRYREFTKCGQKPLAGGQIWTYEANSTTPKITYQDPYGMTPNTNPIILDAAGEADVYLNGTYRFVVKDKNGVIQKDVSKIGSWYSGDLDDQMKSVNDLLESSAQTLMQPLQDAINAAMAASAGDAGWNEGLIATSISDAENQLSLNRKTATVVESISNITSLEKWEGRTVFVKSYHKATLPTTTPYKGGGFFQYTNSNKKYDGIHNFDGWQRCDIDKNIVTTDIAGFYADGTTDDYDSFIRVKKYLLSLPYWSYKKFEITAGTYSIKHFDDDVIDVASKGFTSLICCTGNLDVVGAGKTAVMINYEFNHLDWQYKRFLTDDLDLKPGVTHHPSHATFGVNETFVSHIKNVNISGFTVNFSGEKYYYTQEVITPYLNNGKATCFNALVNWQLNTIENIDIFDIGVVRNPAHQNIGFNNSTAYTDNVNILNVDHYFCGDSSNILLNKCPDHSSIYCNGKYTKISGNKFVCDPLSTINCSIEFHGNGEIRGNIFTNVGAPIYLVNLQNYYGTSEYFKDTEVTVSDNIVNGAIYGMGYSNGGKLTVNSRNNIIKLRGSKSNSTWVDGNLFIHAGIDNRGLVNLNETNNSYTIFNSTSDYFEQQDTVSWGDRDNYINSCIALKNIQELNVVGCTFKNFKGCVLVLDRPNSGSSLPKINLSKNTYINCGSAQNDAFPNFVTDSVIYISNAKIIDFSNSGLNTEYGELKIEKETFINCRYSRCITQQNRLSLFTQVNVDISTQSMFLTPVHYVVPSDALDSFTNYNIVMSFGYVTPGSKYGFGEGAKGYEYLLRYSIVSQDNGVFENTCYKAKNYNLVQTVSQKLKGTSIPANEKPNGVLISDRDSVVFLSARTNETQKLVFNGTTGQWV